jgi:hypothetical protein
MGGRSPWRIVRRKIRARLIGDKREHFAVLGGDEYEPANAACWINPERHGCRVAAPSRSGAYASNFRVACVASPGK